MLPEVIADACKNHKLSVCPLCAKDLLTKWSCAVGAEVGSRAGETNTNQWDYFCSHCNIIWTLNIINSTHEHRAYDEKQHSLRIYGHWYCQCRAEAIICEHIFDDPCQKIHGLVGGHSVLGYQCVADNPFV